MEVEKKRKKERAAPGLVLTYIYLYKPQNQYIIFLSFVETESGLFECVLMFQIQQKALQTCFLFYFWPSNGSELPG